MAVRKFYWEAALEEADKDSRGGTLNVEVIDMLVENSFGKP